MATTRKKALRKWADGTVLFGGADQSGNGHDKWLHAIDKYISLKTAWIKP